MKKHSTDRQWVWSGKCSNCGRCAFVYDDGSEDPCDCRYFLWNKVRYLFIWRYFKKEVELDSYKYDIVAQMFNLSIFHKRIIALYTKWGFRKWKIICGKFYLSLFSQKIVEYYDES